MQRYSNGYLIFISKYIVQQNFYWIAQEVTMTEEYKIFLQDYLYEEWYEEYKKQETFDKKTQNTYHRWIDSIVATSIYLPAFKEIYDILYQYGVKLFGHRLIMYNYPSFYFTFNNLNANIYIGEYESDHPIIIAFKIYGQDTEVVFNNIEQLITYFFPNLQRERALDYVLGDRLENQ